jgi:hypothetical protein
MKMHGPENIKNENFNFDTGLKMINFDGNMLPNNLNNKEHHQTAVSTVLNLDTTYTDNADPFGRSV